MYQMMIRANELAARIRPLLSYNFTSHFNIYANYSYLDARFNDDPEYGDNLLRKTPHNMFNAGIYYRL